MRLFKKEIVVDVFTPERSIFEQCPIRPSAQCLPLEFRNMSSTTHNGLEATFKKCYSHKELMKRGFIIPLWADIRIEMDSSGHFAWESPYEFFAISDHPRTQMPANFFTNYTHMKFVTPWLIEEKTGVQFVWMSCNYLDSDKKENIVFVNGMMAFDRLNVSHINLFHKKGTTSFLERGTPLVQLIPLSDRPIKIKPHLITGEEYRKKQKKTLKFQGSFY